MKKNIKIIFFLFLIVLIPLAYAKEECEDINDILKNRWPWGSNTNHQCTTCYYKVYTYPYSTQLILNYKDNSQYLERSNEKVITSKYKRGVWLKTKDTWKKGIKIWLPEATSEMGQLLNLYEPDKKIEEKIIWVQYTVKCEKEKAKDKFEYVVTSDDESLWTIWLSVNRERRTKDEPKISWEGFLELNAKIKGVPEYLGLLRGSKRDSEEARKYVIFIKKGDKIKTGEEKIVRKEEKAIDEIDLKVNNQIENFANSKNIHLLDIHNLFDDPSEQEIKKEINKLSSEKKVLIKIFTIAPIDIGSYDLPTITDSIADEIEDNFFKNNPDFKDYGVVVIALMRPDMQYHIDKGEAVKHTISITTLNIDGMSRDIVYDSLFDAAGIERSTGRIFGSINEIIKSKEKLMKFFELLIEKGTATKEKPLTKKRIIIDPGHGRECFYSSDKTLAKFETRGRPDQETRLNTRFAKGLKEMMEREFGDSVEIILTREEDNFNPGSSLGLDYTKNYKSENHCSIDDGNSCEQPCNYNKKDEKDRVYCVVDPFYQYGLDTRNRVHVSCIKCIKDNCMNLYNKCPDKEKEFDNCIRASCNDYCISKRESLKIANNDQSIFSLGKKDMEKADLFISIHHNACGEGDYRCYGPYVINTKEHNKLGEELCLGLTEVYNRYKSKNDNKILPKDCYLKGDFIVLNEGDSIDIPSVIIEVGFMDSSSSREIELIGLHKAITADTTPNEVDLLLDSQEPSKSFRNEMQESIIQAVKTYLQIQSKGPTKVSEIDVSDYKKIAIILDDGGHANYDRTIVEKLSEKEAPVTLAVMPGCPYTADVVAEIASKYENSEVILHQPMEAENGQIPECRADTQPKRAIYNSDTNEEVKAKLGANINEIKGYLGEKVDKFVGLNNHMGSLVTQNPNLMSAIALYLKDNNLLFVDSWTTSASVAYKIMKENGIKTFKSNLFLDTEGRDPAKELEKLEQQSIDNGYSVGIGHFKTETVDELFKYIDEHYTPTEDASLGHKTYVNHDKKIKLAFLTDLPDERTPATIVQEDNDFGLKQSALERLKEIKSRKLPDNSLYETEEACAQGVSVVLDYVFGLGTSGELGLMSKQKGKDAWEHRKTILEAGGEVIYKRDEIDFEKIPPGSIFGIFYSTSNWNNFALNDVGYTHIGFYLGDNKVIHKYPDKFRVDSIQELESDEPLEKGGGTFKIREAMIPPISILNKDRTYKTTEVEVDEDIRSLLTKNSVPKNFQPILIAEIVKINDIKGGASQIHKSGKRIKIPIVKRGDYDIEVLQEIPKEDLQGKELIKYTLKNSYYGNRIDLEKWTNAVFDGMQQAEMPITPETVSLVLTIIEQESSFDPIPYVDLDKLCTNLPRRCSTWGIKKLEICKTGNEQCDYFFLKHTGQIRGNLFASNMLDAKKGDIQGGTALEKQVWSIIGPSILDSIEINMGPMQVKSFRVKETLAKRQNKDYQDVEIDGQTFTKLFTVGGGIEFGVDYLNQVLSVYLRHSDGKVTGENIKWILADYNGGAYSSRNAELQYELYKLIENKDPYPNFVDGDFLRWEAYLMPDSSQSLTEGYVKRFVDRYPTYYTSFFKGSNFESITKFKNKYPQYYDVYLDSLDFKTSAGSKIPFFNNWVFDPIRAQLILEKTTEFEETPISKAIKKEYENKFNPDPPFGIVPSAKIISYKHGVEWGAQIYVDRAIKKFDSFCTIAKC